LLTSSRDELRPSTAFQSVVRPGQLNIYWNYYFFIFIRSYIFL
jgi:hypothetical protein